MGQLNLFFDTNESEISDNLTEGHLDDRNDDAHTTRTSHPGALETLSADDGRETGSGESTPASGLRGTGADGGPTLRVDGSSEDGLPIRVGDRDEGMGVPPGRGRSAPAIVRSSDPRPAPTLARDLRITSAHAIGEGSLKQKAQANLDAIRTLRAIEADNRPATPEEKAVLVKYVGW